MTWSVMSVMAILFAMIASAAYSAPPYHGIPVTFDEEFDAFAWSPTGSQRWMTRFPYGGTAERTLTAQEDEYYSDASVGVDPFRLHDGLLDITAALGPNRGGKPYTSGLITTYRSFKQLYGYFEMRAKLPTGPGLWPAFWLLPADNSWPPEIDIFEVLGKDPIHPIRSPSTPGRLGVTHRLPHRSTQPTCLRIFTSMLLTGSQTR